MISRAFRFLRSWLMALGSFRGPKYVALSWVLSTPRTGFGHWIRLGNCLTHSLTKFGNLEGCHFKFILGVQCMRGQHEKSSFFQSNHIVHVNCIDDWSYNNVDIVDTQFTLIVTHVIMCVSFVNHKPCHMPIKYMCPIMYNDRISFTYLFDIYVCMIQWLSEALGTSKPFFGRTRHFAFVYQLEEEVGAHFFFFFLEFVDNYTFKWYVLLSRSYKVLLC